MASGQGGGEDVQGDSIFLSNGLREETEVQNDKVKEPVSCSTPAGVGGNDEEVQRHQEDQEDVCEWIDEGDKDEEERISLGLVERLWSEKILNPNAFMATIKNVWVT